MAGTVDGEARAWAWVAHLREGGTTPWSRWYDAADPADPAVRPTSGPARRAIPGAQQLELLRRLNAARAGGTVPDARPNSRLVERVLAASAPGRGSPDLELAGVREAGRFGPRSVDPAEVSEDELLRVATSLLAEDVVALGTPPPVTPGRVRPWRRPYRLAGSPWLVTPLREELVRRGRPPGGAQPVVLVVGADLASLLTQAWTARAFDEGGASWPEWLRSAVGSDRVPPRAHLEQMARRWTGPAGPGRVRIVLDATGVPRQLGVRLDAGWSGRCGPPVLSADGVDLGRRVGAPLGLLVPPPRRAELLRRGFAPRLASAGGAPLAVPAEHHEWVRRRAALMRDRLLHAGYPVVGDPERLVPGVPQAGTQPDPTRVLALALRLLLDPRDPLVEGGTP